MARKGLEAALEALGSGPVLWGGFGTDSRVSKDTIIADRRSRRSAWVEAPAILPHRTPNPGGG